MGRWKSWVAAGAVAVLALCAGAAQAGDSGAAPGKSPENTSLLEELDRLRAAQQEMAARVEAQQVRIAELEARVSEGDTGGSGGMDSSIAEYLKKGIPSKKGSMLRFYGSVRLDVAFDDSTPSNTQTIGWVKSEDPTAAGGATRNDADLTIYPRLTRVGMELDGGKVASLNDAKLAGKIEVDFYNNGLAGQSESRAALRMRHAFLTLHWGADTLLAGQTSDLISPLWPIVNPDMIDWGVGNLGDRRPQVRWTHVMEAGEKSKFTLAGMAGLTGAVDNQNLDTDGVRDGEASAFPTLQARAAYAFPMGESSAEIGVWGDYAREEVMVPIAGEHNFQSACVGLDANLPFGKCFTESK